jgi:chemotaxis signal transduction protein
MSVHMDDQSPNNTSSPDRGTVKELRERAEVALDTLTVASSHHDADIMLARARDLARPTEVSIETSELTDVVVFHVAAGAYAVETTHTHHIIRISSLAPIPGSEGGLRGVCVYAGEIIPVFDVSDLLGEAGDPPSANGWALLLGSAEIELAVLVDRIDSVRSIRTSQIEKLSRAALLSEAGNFIAGTLPEGLTVINAAQLLDHKTMRVAR